ncbi:hypothetical protein DL98DRAFT_437572, partial [Cadophora sp. DSE1049]
FKLRMSKPLITKRKTTHEKEEILVYFYKFEITTQEYYIKKSNCWNFDETG